MVKSISLVTVLLLVAATTVRAGTTDTATELAALKARVAQLESQNTQSWLNARRAEEVKSLVREVLSDADTRASLLQDGMTAGHNGQNFWIGSADGNFLLTISGLVQVRYTYNHRNAADASSTFLDTDRNEAGFTIPRAKIQFAGHVSSPRIQYAIRLAVDRNTNDVWADKIVLSYCLADNLWISGGEDKAPFLREELTEPENQLAVDRSLVNEIFTAGRVQGVWVKWHASDMIHVAAAISDGMRSGERKSGTFSSKDFYEDNSDFAITARVDAKLAGDWKQAEDFTAWSGEPFAAFVGAAIHWESRETGDHTSSHSYDTLLWTVDGSIETNGANLYAAVMGANFNSEFPNLVSIGNNPDPLGIVVQGGYQIIPDKLEPFVRWEYLDLDVPQGSAGDDNINLLTFGANYYLNKNRAKFTVDLVWALDTLDLSGLSSSGYPLYSSGESDFAGLGLLSDNSNTNQDQLALRAQFTLTF